MPPEYPPSLPLPADLPDEAAVALYNTLLAITAEIQGLYAAQLQRHRQPPNERQLDFWDDQPPF